MFSAKTSATGGPLGCTRNGSIPTCRPRLPKGWLALINPRTPNIKEPCLVRARESGLDTVLYVTDQRLLCALYVAFEGAVQKLSMFPRRDLAPIHVRHHLVTQIFVVDRTMDIEQSFGIAGRYQRAMEFPVVPLPQLCDRPVAFCHLPFEDGQLVISRDTVALPFQVTLNRAGSGFRAACSRSRCAWPGVFPA